MVRGSDVLTYRVFEGSGDILKGSSVVGGGAPDAVVEASDTFSSVTDDHIGNHGSSFLLQKRSAAASSCLFLPFSHRPCGDDLWQRPVDDMRYFRNLSRRLFPLRSNLQLVCV